MYRILIVDDEKIERTGLRLLLGKMDQEFEITEAVNGKEALEWLSCNRADILVTDIRMPFVDGLELVEQAARLYPDMKAMIFSGYGEFEYARRAMRFGVEEYILKPVNPTEFQNAIKKIIQVLEESKQEKALEALGFELPEPEKPVGRKNNRKMTFDSACRVLLFDVAKKHGLQLEEEPEYGGRAYLEKQDYILFKQKEQLAAQEQKLEELTMKIEDVEALVDEVADIAYDKAVEVVADTVKLETHKEDIKLVEQSKAWVLSPERKASKKEVEYAVKRLDGVIARITNAMKSTIQKIQTTLMKPEVKKAGTEQIKKKAKSSIIEQLSRKKKEIAEREVSRTDQAKSKKQDMEL